MSEDVFVSRGLKQPTSSKWSRGLFAIAHAWLIFHLLSVILPPLSVEPSSPVLRQIWPAFGWYIHPLFLNHGYQFFAPEPGPSSLLEYEYTFANGEKETGRLPNRDLWPRLLYHRHFMLTEQLAAYEDLTPELQRLLIRSYARALLEKNSASQVRLTRVTHLLPRMERIQAGASLEDVASYRRMPLGTFSRAELEQSVGGESPSNSVPLGEAAKAGDTP